MTFPLQLPDKHRPWLSGSPMSDEASIRAYREEFNNVPFVCILMTSYPVGLIQVRWPLVGLFVDLVRVSGTVQNDECSHVVVERGINCSTPQVGEAAWLMGHSTPVSRDESSTVPGRFRGHDGGNGDIDERGSKNGRRCHWSKTALVLSCDTLSIHNEKTLYQDFQLLWGIQDRSTVTFALCLDSRH